MTLSNNLDASSGVVVVVVVTLTVDLDCGSAGMSPKVKSQRWMPLTKKMIPMDHAVRHSQFSLFFLLFQAKMYHLIK